ncbi:hypothetical protein GJ744_002118 [Endocarpon pusillum]|uniref:Uncharacterized protein n=1 Tax=Endocarpon pusillum TaxID=364733 RepID=A0A8H7ACE1_9EURO|nr:hypothetical protein GJ744_002118 [Endocarpon pusillum]
MSEDKIEDALCTRLFAALYDSGFFAQRIVADGPEQMRSWSAVTYESLSILMGSLHEECRLLLPLNHFPEEQDSLRDPQRQTSLLITDLRTQNRRAIKTFSTVNQKNVFDTGFLPDWMYHYPAFIHKQELVINLQEELKQLSSFEGLKSAVDSCKSSKDFSNIRYRGIPFFPGVIDSGVKKLTRPENFFATHQISVESYYDGASFWDKLRKPRTPDQAKKRLIELSSQDKNSALMCWLSSPQQEKPLLLRFLRRHERLGSFFGERADLKGNLWETEFHLGFYRLLDDTANFSSQNRVREMPTLSHTQASRSIAQVGIGFRFIGDLRDRFWSCHFLSSETVGFKGLVRQYFESSETREELYEKQGQRKTLELVYVERALNEMVSSINEILDAFKTELAVPSKGQSFDNYSMLRFHLEAGDILRDVLGQLNFSVKVIEEWEKREDTRGLRSRWSLKDEDRYGEKLKDLTRKSKLKLQQLHLQQSQLGEQQRYAAQRHSDIVSYQQLQEARTSARFAEDVRLFTYVTIIFLPLSFSSSLFSMQATPTAATLAVMGPTTIIALALTILVLANMKLVDRKLSFWVDKANHNAREKMSTSKNSWASDWSKISSELSEAAQLRLTKLDNKQRLSAESKWWYFFFWLYYCLDIPRIHVLRGFRAWQNQNGLTLHLIVMVLIAAPACTLIFIVQVLILMVSDTLKLIWAMFCQLVQKMFSQPQIEQSQARDEKAMERRPKDRSNEKDKDSISRGTTASKISSVQSARRRISRTLYQWLKSPPRPIKDYRQKKYPPAGDQQGNEPKTMDPSDTDTNSESSNASSIHTTELPSDEEDEWTNPTGDGAATDVTTVKPHLNASKIPAEGATVNDSRTNVEDFV